MPKIFFKIHRDGTTSDIKILESAGTAADKAAIDAVERTSPLDPLPASARDTVEITFTFIQNWSKNDGIGIYRNL